MATVPPEKREQYQRLVDTHDEVELKGGDKLPYTSVNGNMFSQMSKDGRLGIRLSDSDREAFIAEHNAQLFKNYGAVIKEYVEVPEELLADLNALASYLGLSYDYTKTLPAKKKK